MIEHVKYFGKLTATAALSWIKINALGFVSLVVTFTFSYFILFDEKTSSAAEVANSSTLLYTITSKPIQSILLLLIILCPVFILILGNKYIVSKIINRIVNDKSDALLYPVLDKILAKFKTIQPDIIKKGADYSMVKLKLIHQVKNETENKWIKRIIIYGLEKVNLHNEDFASQDADFSTILKVKTMEALHNITEPSRKSIWIVLGLQWLFLLLIWVLN
ncbi:hypothetical protein [Flavobacterium terrisoli]|uniref:hypothetical protein n=1 Tax=Flavobacterium terrisoli TaxID=3242195 RepID=UPI002543B5F0|nr:hypothetical protein [Flavobacterium buctense]